MIMGLVEPKLSILLPVYNVAPYIRETIASILSQTFTDFELIIVDDVSTDDTAAIVASIEDNRILLIRNSQNIGRAGSDNEGIEAVRGKYIAKMDGDDICAPERFALQVAYLDKYPNINVVGSWIQNFGASSYLNKYPEQPQHTQVRTLFTTPTANASVMMRADLFRHQGMHYDASLRQTEDYDFFVRYIRQLSIATIPRTLYYYRIPEISGKKAVLTERTHVSDDTRLLLLKQWQFNATPRELQVYNSIAMLERPLSDIRLQEVENWLFKLLEHNKNFPLFDQAALQLGLSERWFEVCYTHPQGSLGSIRAYLQSRLSQYWRPSLGKYLRFFAKAIRYWNGIQPVG